MTTSTVSAVSLVDRGGRLRRLMRGSWSGRSCIAIVHGQMAKPILSPRILAPAAMAGLLAVLPTPSSALQGSGGLGQGATSGDVGQRQSRSKAAPNYEPLARIETRIQNRVQSRLRNRIDRNYDAQANAASPLVVAEDQTHTPNRRR